MSASLICTACVAAIGRLNRMRFLEYSSASLRQHGRADRAPGDAVARLRQAAERPLEAFTLGRQHGFPARARCRRTARRSRRRAGTTSSRFPARRGPGCPFHQEAVDAIVGPAPRRRIRRRSAIGDPHLRAVDDPVAAACLAWVFMLAGSEPPCGSVRPKQPMISPRAMPGRYFCRCSSLP